MMLRLLLVDEDERSMPMFVAELELLGHRVATARDPAELKKHMSDFDFDGIILDLMMPTSDQIPEDESEFGYQAGVYLYEKYMAVEHSDVPFVVLTAVDPNTSVYARAIATLDRYSGFRGALRKPQDASAVVDRLQAREMGDSH
ncbi:MAG: response regulator [Chloroflexi bacterium]|nr:response regulator [Chloroflexota bacterium]